MSYLSNLRLHFRGSFQASVSTVNNDPTHYDVGADSSSYHKPQTALARNGWWNPLGDQVFRLLNCKVTAAFDSQGNLAPATDPIVGALIGDSNRRAPAKLVDLDPQNQWLSTIYGLEIRLSGKDGVEWLRAEFEPAPFFDLWSRSAAASNNEQGGAAYQSILKDLKWMSSPSAWLAHFQANCPTDKLSIKFNLDGFCEQPSSPDFCRGRIVGTIGPAEKDEPKHFILGRHFVADMLGGAAFPLPAGKIFNCVGVYDKAVKRIRLDLGNSLPTVRALGSKLKGIGQLALFCHQTAHNGAVVGNFKIGDITFPFDTAATKDPATDNYHDRASIIDVPLDPNLAPTQVEAIDSNPLALMLTQGDGSRQVALRETPRGLYARADLSFFRLSPRQRKRLTVYATEFGQPCRNARVLALLDNSWLQASPADPPVGKPITGLRFPTKRKTNSDGMVSWPFWACDPQKPRSYIDGQVYAVRFALAESLQVAVNYPFMLAPWVGFLVWDEYPANEEVSWEGSIKRIFTQYAQLYPVMNRIVDLREFDAVVANREIIRRAMELGFDDPNFMPVSRDLSPAKTREILEWLKNPTKGTPAAESYQASTTRIDGPELPGSGKDSAFARTLLRQQADAAPKSAG